MVEKSADVLTPGPDGSAITPRAQPGPAAAAVERELAAVLADVVHTEHVPPDSHFFTDLGANSLVMAQFCARVRKRADLPSVSMKDIYRHPTIRDLAAALADASPAGTAT
ncbi:acyl carrier protein, partial [Streptomyces mexicanus]|uniref:acyl carrier protein n=1 Tax=Streptomyces mexicanus TaxID=178566 RepID=UPI001F3EABE0